MREQATTMSYIVVDLELYPTHEGSIFCILL